MSKKQSKIDKEIDTALKELKEAVRKIRDNAKHIERVSDQIIKAREKT